MSHRLDISVFSNPLFEIGSVVLVLWKNETGWPIEMVTKNIEPLTGYDSNDFLQKKFAFSSQITTTIRTSYQLYIEHFL